MPVIDLGKVVGDPGASMRFRGEWNSGSEYFNNSSYVDTVTHHGSLWVCKQTNIGQEPIEGDYWGIGAQGNSDLNASDVTYNNESSGLSSNTAQGAIDEIVEIEKVVNGNQADSYSPDETYKASRLVIHNNALWKAKQDIDVAEAWTPEHWEPTTLAAELSAVNSRMPKVFRVGTASGLKSGDTVNIGEPVPVNCMAFVSPIYNADTTRRCIMAAQFISAGGNTFQVSAYDTETGSSPTADDLMIAYIVVDRS